MNYSIHYLYNIPVYIYSISYTIYHGWLAFIINNNNNNKFKKTYLSNYKCYEFSILKCSVEKKIVIFILV